MNDHSMFSFLVDEAPDKSVDLELIGEFAKEASSAFLGPGQIPLNQSIVKIAKAENLTPENINLLCQETNKQVHQHMFKTAEDKYIDFSIANPNEIMCELEGSEKTASEQLQRFSDLSSDYEAAPGETETYFNDFTITKTAGKCGLYDNSKRKKKAAIEKLAFEKQKIKEELFIKEAEIESAEKRFVKVARNQLLQYPLQNRRSQFPYLAKFCKEAGMRRSRANQLLGLLDHVMVRQGLLEKSADIKADPELISENLNARIINGTHPLQIEVKTIVEKDKEKELIEDRGHNLIKDKVDSFKANGAVLDQKLKEL
jgi:hypothetical protein